MPRASAAAAPLSATPPAPSVLALSRKDAEILIDSVPTLTCEPLTPAERLNEETTNSVAL